MEISHISRNGKAKAVYGFEETFGSNNINSEICLYLIYVAIREGDGFVAYNPRRNILGAIPCDGEIAYHLFKIDIGASKPKDIVKLCRKTKWHGQHDGSNAQAEFNEGFFDECKQV